MALRTIAEPIDAVAWTTPACGLRTRRAVSRR